MLNYDHERFIIASSLALSLETSIHVLSRLQRVSEAVLRILVTRVWWNSFKSFHVVPVMGYFA